MTRSTASGQLRATASSAQVGYDAGNALDANPSSMWHTAWSPPAALPQSITLDLGHPRHARALLYTPRYDGNPNGNATAYTLYTSIDGRTYRPAGSGTWIADATTKSVPVVAG